MPTPQKGQSKEDFIKICIPELIKEGKDQNQAIAQCNSIWEQNLKKDLKTVIVDGFESPAFGEDLSKKGIDILGSTYANCRAQWVKDHPDDKENKANKTSCSRIAWNAVNEAGEKGLKLETAELRDVEIAQEGTFRDMGGRFIDLNKKKFENFIQNFNNKITQPVITINHNKKETKEMQSIMRSANLGIVDKLRIAGKSLIADFKNIPRKLAELIKAGTFQFRSMEFFDKFKDAKGGVFDDVLTGVTFHGGADGSSAITTLSDVMNLFKDEPVEQQENLISIEFKNKEVRKMSKIEIDKTEYESLLKNNEAYKELKTDSDKKDEEINNLKSETETLKTEAEDKDKKIEEAEKFKKDVEENQEITLKKEAEDYIDGLIKDKKIMPKFKDMEVDNYIRYSKEEGDEPLNLFKEKLESAQEVVNLGETITDEDGNEVPAKNELKTEDDEKRALKEYENLIKSGTSEEEALVKTGLATADEVGLKQEVS